MQIPFARLQAAGLAAMLLAPAIHAQQIPAPEPERSQELATLRAELAAQRELVDKLMQELQAQRAKIDRIEDDRLEPAPMLADGVALPARVDDGMLDEQRGTGGQNAGTAQAAPAVQTQQQQNQQQPNQQRQQQNQQQSNQQRQQQNQQPVQQNQPAVQRQNQPVQQQNQQRTPQQNSQPNQQPVQQRTQQQAAQAVPPQNLQQNQVRNQQQNQPQRPPTNPPPSTPGPINGGAPAQAAARAQAPAPAQNNTTATRNQQDQRPPEVAPLFEAPGVLTPRGRFILEPSLQFGYSSSNRVALVGYTVIPALLIGLVDVREVKRNTFTGSIAARTGLSNRMEVEVRAPYVYRSDATVSREIFTGTSAERVFNTTGKDLGDIELAGRYQLNNGGPDKPYYIAGMRYKSTTGKDPFEVITDCQTRCLGENVTGTGLPLSLPTGSGFHSLQGSLTFLFPSDPAVFFGNISYLHNFKRSDVQRLVRDGVREPLGELEPGAIIGFNFGMGLALNEKASLSLGYDHSTVGRMKQNGRTLPGSVRTQLGTLLLGYSYRLSEKRSLSVAVGAGVTRDTPDVSLTVRMPFSF